MPLSMGIFQCLILWLLLLDKIIILDNAVYIKDITIWKAL